MKAFQAFTVGIGVMLMLALAQTASATGVVASGGNKTNDIDGYRVHTFTNSATAGSFDVTDAGNGVVEVLVVAGGGAGGGGNNGGGGGAGGYLYEAAHTISAQSYVVTVGTGGVGNTSAGTAASGGNSVFDTITATGGGGGGGGGVGAAGGTGGSGGGGDYYGGAHGTKTPSPLQGNDGANGVNADPWPGGGGGGAGIAASGAQGGTGLVCSISGSAKMYAGGGSGGRNSTVLLGGAGGGGNGAGNSPSTAATAGAPNTGGGGGGCQTGHTQGGNGGSGIVIIRYLISPDAPLIQNRPVTNVLSTSASLYGYLSLTGSSPATVSVYWGETNGGTIAANWANTNTFAEGQWVNGDYPITNVTLSANRNYYYNYFAQNGSTSVWSTTLPQYFITGDLTVQATDATGRSSPGDTATFTIYRPDTCTNENLVVNYTIGGTASNVTDYSIGSLSTVTLLAGQTNADIVVTPVFKVDAEKTVILTLAAGAYPTGTPSSATCTLMGIPEIGNRPATNVLAQSAFFNASISATSASPATVSVYWGETNGGTTAENWTHTNTFAEGQWVAGDHPTTNIATLAANQNYYYNYFTQNGTTSSWSTTLPQYLITGDVTVQATDATGRTIPGDTATFTVYRPDTCTNDNLVVNYTLGGTAANGADYSVPSTNSVTLLAGQTNADIVVTPVYKVDAEKTVILTLATGPYPTGTPSSATCTLAAMAPADLTLSANAHLNGSGQLINDVGGGVLLTASSGTGTQADPYVFYVLNLDMGAYTIRGNSSSVNQYSATWHVSGSVTGSGNFDSYTDQNGCSGGHVRIEAGGGIALNRIRTYSHYGYAGGNSHPAGNVYLWATGTVAVASYIRCDADYDIDVGGTVTIRSEGPVSGQGITIAGTIVGSDSTTNSISTGLKVGVAGNVSLYCQTNITLAGGISTRAGQTAGQVLVRGSFADANARAGAVVVPLSGIRTDPTQTSGSGPSGGNVTVKATSLLVGGNIITRSTCYYRRTGNVDIDVLETATVRGFIDTRIVQEVPPYAAIGSPGHVKILGRHIAVLGVDGNGDSIRTWPGSQVSPATDGSQAGDADVTLTNVDTSTEIYNPANPTNSRTSSIVVAGRINTGRWYSNNAMGNVRISAVEVQLGGDVTNASTTASTILAMHYGVITHGIVTHLVENAVRWDSVAAHNITYTAGSGTLTFTPDVPYAGVSFGRGTLLILQ